MPNVLSFETKVDLSGLNSGMSQATAAVGQFAGSIKGAMQAAADATARLAEAQDKLGARAATGEAQAIAVIKQYEQELRVAQAAVEAMSQTQNNYISTATSAAAASRLFASSVDQVGSSAAHAVPEIAAASSAIRVMDGSLPIRAVERFAVTTLGLGPILQAAFPVFGAIALGEIVVEGISKLHAMYVEAENLGNVIQAAFQKINDSAKVANDTLAVSNDRLQADLDKLEGKAGTGLQLGLDQAAESADKLAISLGKDIDAVDKLLKENQVGFFGKLLGKAPTDADAAQITAYDAKIKQISQSYDETIDSATAMGASQKNLSDIRASEATRLEAVYADATTKLRSSLNDAESIQDHYDESKGLIGTDQIARINTLRGALEAFDQQQKQIGASMLQQDLQPKVDAGKADHSNSSMDDKANRARLKAMEASLNEEKLEYNVSVKAEYDYWQERIDTFNQGSAQYDTILQKMSALAVEGARKADEGIAKYKKDASEVANLTPGNVAGFGLLTEALLKQGEGVSRTGEAWNKYHEELAKSPGIQAQASAVIQLSTIAQGEAIGTISKVSASQQIAAIHSADWASKIAALNAELARLQALAAAAPKDPVTGQMTNGPLAGQIQGVKNQLDQANGQSQASSVADTTATATAISQPYTSAFNTINNGFLQVQQKMIMGTRSISRDFAQMGANLVASSATWAEKQIAQEAAKGIKILALDVMTAEKKRALDQLISSTHHQIALQDATLDTTIDQQGLASHAAVTTEKVSVDASGAASSVTIQQATGAESRLDSAKTAFSNTYAQVSGWPVVGPVLAPEFAAAAFVGALAFDVGGVIPGSGAVPIIGHGGERVLTQGQTSTFEKFVSNMNSGNSSSNSVTQNNHYSGMSDAGFRRMMSRNADHTVSTVRRGLRKQGKV